MKKPFVLKQSVIAVALTIGVSHVALAQQQAAQPIQKVVVTGSNIKRAVDEETSSPVQVIGRMEIAAIGASTVKDVLDTLTSKASDLTDLGGGNSFASGATGISLRNLGKGSTLTLLNGRRVANYGLADGGQETFVNIDAMPSEIIDRIEILLDGASAVYGSDAVAGVVNIITRKDFSGVMVGGSMRQSLLKSAVNKDRTASLTGGSGDFEKDGYNVFGHFEAYHRVPYDDRTIMPAAPGWFKEYVNPNFGVKSTYAYPGNFVDRYPANYSDPALAGKSFNAPVAGCTDIEDGTCRFDQWARYGAHAEAKRYNFFGSGRLKLGGNRTAFSEVTLGQTTTTYYNPPPTMSYTGTPSTWFNSKEGKLNSFLEPKLPVGHPNNPYSFPVALRYRYADDVSMFKSEAQAKQYRVMVGLEGSDYGWDWNTAVGAMGSKVENNIRGNKHAATYLAAINSGEYKFGGVNSPELLNKMFPNLLFGGESKQAFIDFKATRELMQLSGGPLSLAVGGDFRTDSFDAYVSDNIANAEIVGYGSINVTGSRHISAAFAELNAPITKALELNAAMRVDKVGDTDISVVPKVGMRFQVSKSVLLRGTVANGFRAPNVAETGKVDLSAFQNSQVDPKRCATATQLYNILKEGNTIDKADALTARDRGCSVSFASQVKGNPALEPEKSRSYNVGIVLQPLDNLSMTLDYYRIERRNEIGTKTTSQILADEDRLPGSVQRRAVTEEDKRFSARAQELSGKNIQYPIGPVGSISNRYENMDRSKVSGIDVEINHRWNLGSAGRLVSNLKGNYQLDYRKWDTVTDTFTEDLSANYENYQYQVRGSTAWISGPFKVGAAVTFRPETTLVDDQYDVNYNAQGCEDQGIPTELCRVKKDFITDLNMSYTGIKNTTIALNLYNVFNREASPDLRISNPTVRGRSARVSLQYTF